MQRTKDFPRADFEGTACEIWQGLNASFYHMAYVKTYADTIAMHTAGSNCKQEIIEAMSETERDCLQEDLVIFRAHFAAYLWQLCHLRELVRESYRRLKEETVISQSRYDTLLAAIDADPIVEEIREYRNMSHQRAGVIVTLHDTKTNQFQGHFFPPLHETAPTQKKEVSVDDELRERELNMKLNTFYGNMAGYCQGLFKIIDAKYNARVLTRTQGFSVTVPYSYNGKLPEGAKDVIYVRDHHDDSPPVSSSAEIQTKDDPSVLPQP
jgi:hypothetical protein